MDEEENILCILSEQEESIKWYVEPEMPRRIVAGSLSCLQLLVVSLAVCDLACLVQVGPGVDSESILEQKQVRKVEKEVDDAQPCHGRTWFHLVVL